MPIFTELEHHKTYDAISPSNAVNKQTGRTILITGSTEGIGFSIAKAFIAAEADRIIILGRREALVNSASEQLNHLAASTDTEIHGRTCDISSEADVQSLWQWLSKYKIRVDVLILNAAAANLGSLKDNLADIWNCFEVNVLANLRMTQAFMAQKGFNDHAAVLNVSTAIAHSNPAPSQGAYSASKAGFANLLQHFADEVSAEEVQMINFHPGSIFTSASQRFGMDENTLPWDHEDLPGHFAVWASTDAASFLHGRFVWANWDVNELIKRKQEILDEPGLLKIGLQGAGYLDVTKMFSS